MMPACAILVPETALTAIGTSCRDSVRFCAVTVISESVVPPSWADAAALARASSTAKAAAG